MNENFAVEPAVLKAKLLSETARIGWQELQRFYAAGAVLSLSPSLDLVEVAYAIAVDDKAAVADWLARQQLHGVTDTQALFWHQQQQELWAVVVSPWVLVQESRQPVQ